MLWSSLFRAAPLFLTGILLWRFIPLRRIRWRSLLLYILFLIVVLTAALHFVAWIASSRVAAWETVVVLWFTIAWRLAWELWSRTIGRIGRKRQRWARLRRHQGRRASFAIRLIPIGRVFLTIVIFGTVFLSTILTHRFKLLDNEDPESVFGIPFESVRIPTADGLTLDGWFIPAPRADRTILICHGAGANKGNFIWFLGPLAHHGYNIVFFDFLAHGASDGRTITYGIREQQDVLAAVNWLKQDRTDQARTIVGLGSSQGAMALALAAAEDPRIDAIILDSPFLSPKQLMLDLTAGAPIIGPAWGTLMLAAMSAQTGANFFLASAEQALAALGDRPVLIIHGDDDVIMPASHAQRLYEAAPGPRELWLAPGSHSNIVTTVPEEYATNVFKFLDAHCPATKR